MNDQAFKKAYGESRNGANGFFRHTLVPYFQFSDGVNECADAGCYWLLDIVATECCKPLRKSGCFTGLIHVKVQDSKALLTLTTHDEAPPLWKKSITWTDMPEGEWVFYLADETERFAMCLLDER